MTENKEPSLWRPLALFAALVVAIWLAKHFGAGEWISRLRDHIEELGIAGIFVFIAVYVVGVVAVLPGSALTLIAGALFGPVLGIVVVSVASTVGACFAFLIARYFARESVSAWLNKSERFRKLDKLTETHGSTIVALTRLVPILPFNLLNYAFGLTRVPFWTYLFWSWVCMLPATAIYVIGMDVVASALAEGRVSWSLAGLLAVIAALFATLYRFARKKLATQLPESN
ncbi:MAG TPA: TVP38/TMEM64 family protein [Bdellovibrionales bacterium]|nr:TVP38/TMEM64 family protein [Bdellovibrionales bacterium]